MPPTNSAGSSVRTACSRGRRYRRLPKQIDDVTSTHWRGAARCRFRERHVLRHSWSHSADGRSDDRAERDTHQLRVAGVLPAEAGHRQLLRRARRQRHRWSYQADHDAGAVPIRRSGSTTTDTERKYSQLGCSSTTAATPPRTAPTRPHSPHRRRSRESPTRCCLGAVHGQRSHHR